MTKILAIETSCDETAAALVEKQGNTFTVLANVVQSQASLHAKWGGVVPDLASREHIQNIAPVIDECLQRANVTSSDIDALAVTQGPGLMPALVVGVNAVKMLATLWNKPVIGIHHLEGHIYANLLRPDQELRFSLLALVVSGGHTQLVLMEKDFSYRILGETQDDAVGEAFDKVAKILGLPYPGGPEIAVRADEYIKNASEEEKDTLQSLFPRPMMDTPNYDFSFSGLKTAVLYYVQKHESEKETEDFRKKVAYAFQCAALEVLRVKTKKALQEFQPQTFVVAGGVSANVSLREQLEKLVAEEFPNTQFLMPEFTYSLDNAAMIGAAAVIRFENLSQAERETLLKESIVIEPSAILPLHS
jgi:N6-L-threonylcarbamoyladenine synthase